MFLHVLLLVVNPCLVLVQHSLLPTCLPCLLRWTATLLDWHTSSLWRPLARWGRLSLELLRRLTLELLLRNLSLELLRLALALELLLLLILLWVDSRRISLLSSGCVAQR